MLYKLAADSIVLIHFGFIIFVVLGGLLVLSWPKIAWVHIPAAAWGVWIELSHGVCPITPLEQSLRDRAGATNYEGSFINQYIVPIIYPPDFSPQTAQVFGFALMVFTMTVYSVAIYRKRRPRVAGSSDF
ncbi:MAG TPA: DUF2784 domain-containing protein [Xanthomonadales bacterium]|nr:DUF2784 domain-containing protein [Xanthomonadales bacterium]